MDKLQPILKHHFWILLVPLLSMNLWGFFSANSAMSEATKKRESDLNTVKSQVPAGTTDPNEKYATELGKQNEVLKKYVNEELQQLWARQQARMTWPQAVAADVPKVFRADISDNLVRFAYQNVYFQDVIKPLHESVEPVVLNAKDLTYVPKVDFPPHLIPQMKVGNFTITSEQMWDAQEDVWMTQLILDAIRQMNKDADSTNSAVIRRVISYRLLGGDGTPVLGGAAAGGESSMSSMMAMGGDMPEGSTGMPMGGGPAGGGGTKVQTSVKFNPAEEFGSGGEATTNTGMGGSAAMMMSMMPSEDGAASAAAGTGETGVLRYVNDKDEIPYRERGFYLSVIINQNKLVDFLVALSNSEWPIKVVRFQFGKNPWKTDEFRNSGATGGAMAMGGMSSMMMGGQMAANDPVNNPFGSGASGATESMMSSMTGGNALGGAGGFGGPAGANTGYKITDLDHPDLIQLDLAGLITIFKDPAAAATGDGATPEEGTTPAEGTTPTEGTPPGEASAAAPPAEAAPAGTADASGVAAPTEPAAEGAPAAAEGTPAATAEPASAGTPASDAATGDRATTPEPAAEAPPDAPAPASPQTPAPGTKLTP